MPHSDIYSVGLSKLPGYNNGHSEKRYTKFNQPNMFMHLFVVQLNNQLIDQSINQSIN